MIHNETCECMQCSIQNKTGRLAQNQWADALARLAESEGKSDAKSRQITVFLETVADLERQLAESRERERVFRDALTSMRCVFETQQMTTLQVAKMMLDISVETLALFPPAQAIAEEPK